MIAKFSPEATKTRTKWTDTFTFLKNPVFKKVMTKMKTKDTFRSRRKMIYFKCLSWQEIRVPHLKEKPSVMAKLGFPRAVKTAGNGNA